VPGEVPEYTATGADVVSVRTGGGDAGDWLATLGTLPERRVRITIVPSRTTGHRSVTSAGLE